MDTRSSAACIEYGYLDDAAFAETYARSASGKREVRPTTRAAGFCSARVFRQGIDPLETLEARYGQTNEEALARQHLEHASASVNLRNQKETARVMRRLVTAGFSTGVIYKILRQWDVPEESLVALDNLEDEPHDD